VCHVESVIGLLCIIVLARCDIFSVTLVFFYSVVIKSSFGVHLWCETQIHTIRLRFLVFHHTDTHISLLIVLVLSIHNKQFVHFDFRSHMYTGPLDIGTNVHEKKSYLQERTMVFSSNNFM
jgi:hypothetical protein